MSAPADAFRATLEAAEPHGGARDAFLALLDAEPGAIARDHGPVHFTASGIVVDASGTHVALHLHRKVGAWLQFGGHIEATDSSFEAAARREVTEESDLEDLEIVGLPGRPGAPLRLHPHELNSNFTACSEHWDVQFLFRAPFTPDSAAAGLALAEAESQSLAWFSLDQLQDGLVEDLAPVLQEDVPARLAL